jgi:hypothetical protein
MFEPKVSPIELSIILLKLHSQLKSVKIKNPVVRNIRHDWIKATSSKIIEVLEKEIKIYNEKNPDVKLKSGDVLATVNTVLNRLLKAMGLLKPLS